MPLPAGTVVLLGAGASADAGVPTTFRMTEQLVTAINNQFSWGEDKAASALHFVCAALMAYDAAQEGRSPFIGLDVERVFAAVDLLAERRTLEVTPFVASWHPAVDAADETRANNAPAFFDRNLREALEVPDSPTRGRFTRPGNLFTRSTSQWFPRPRSGGDAAARLIAQLIDSRIGGIATGRTYSQLRERMLGALTDLVTITPSGINYLRPLVSQGKRKGGLTIATLNYDLALEQAAKASRVALTTGIEAWLRTGRWDWPSKGVRLLKLHGSINWRWDEQNDGGHLPRDVVAVAEDPAEDRRRPAIVFGHRGKLRAEGPFLGLLAQFEAQLARARRLIVIGYSFRDDHVNEIIRRWTAEDSKRTILLVDPEWDSASLPNKFQKELDTRFRASSGDAPRLEVWPIGCKEAVPKLVKKGRP